MQRQAFTQWATSRGAPSSNKSCRIFCLKRRPRQGKKQHFQLNVGSRFILYNIFHPSFDKGSLLGSRTRIDDPSSASWVKGKKHSNRKINLFLFFSPFHLGGLFEFNQGDDASECAVFPRLFTTNKKGETNEISLPQ